MVAQKVLGFPIPLRYINPSLQFYPLILPKNVSYARKNNYNHINNAIVNVILNRQDHLYFINLLLNSLNRNFTIVDDYLIDLTRKEYSLYIDRNKNEISRIQNYNFSKPIKLVNEKFFKNVLLSKVNLDLNYNFYNSNNKHFIEEHCKRIVSNTLKIKSMKFFPKTVY